MISSITMERAEVVAEGREFGAAGCYRRLIGKAKGVLAPAAAENRAIADIDLAPRNAAGLIEYETDFFILAPVEPARGNGRLLYEVNNRGRKMLFANLCAAAAGNDLKSPADFGDALPLRLGFTIVWSGWDATVKRVNAALGFDGPIAQQAGRPITRFIRDEFVPGTRPDSPVDVFRLSFPAASLEQGRSRLSFRRRQADPRQELAAGEWQFLDERRVRLMPEGRALEPGSLYELVYPAHGSPVLGIGFAATRDLVSYLRYEAPAADLLGFRPSHALGFGISQAGRYLRTHIALGFNRDEQGRRVFDGVLAHTAGSGRVFLNELFAQPFRTNTQHEDHDFPENEFPFSTARLRDPLTEVEGSLFRGDGSDPFFMQTNTSTEYWQKGASLLHTDPLAERDVSLPEGARAYLIAGTQHGGRPGSPSNRGPAANPRNPHNPMPAVRALLVALDGWVADGRVPPPSAVPCLAEATLVPAEAAGFPELPGVAVARQANRIAPPGGWVEPKPGRRAYRTLVPKVDPDGNELSGVRLPDIAVPLGTYTGWNLYREPFPEDELADRDGSFIPLAKTAAERERNGDPRPALAERYPNRWAYVAEVERAAAELVERRLLLPEDAVHYLERARRLDVFPQGDGSA